MAVFAITGCASTAGKLEGRIKFTNSVGISSVHPCQISEYQSNTQIDEANIDWSGISSEGWSADKGFRWQGNVSAPGFVCVLNSELKFSLGNNINANEEKAFTILNVPAGKYSIVVTLTGLTGSSAKLVYGENGVPLVIEMTTKHGDDIGLHIIENK